MLKQESSDEAKWVCGSPSMPTRVEESQGLGFPPGKVLGFRSTSPLQKDQAGILFFRVSFLHLDISFFPSTKASQNSKLVKLGLVHYRIIYRIIKSWDEVPGGYQRFHFFHRKTCHRLYSAIVLEIDQKSYKTSQEIIFCCCN